MLRYFNVLLRYNTIMRTLLQCLMTDLMHCMLYNEYVLSVAAVAVFVMPLSNLPFLSKLLERVVQNQLHVFLDSNDLMPRAQSVYRQYHSTETAVMKVHNDMLLAADNGQVTVLYLLDLTAAFDTVDHGLSLIHI